MSVSQRPGHTVPVRYEQCLCVRVGVQDSWPSRHGPAGYPAPGQNKALRAGRSLSIERVASSRLGNAMHGGGAGDLARVTAIYHVALRKHARPLPDGTADDAADILLYGTCIRQNVRQLRRPLTGKL